MSISTDQGTKSGRDPGIAVETRIMDEKLSTLEDRVRLFADRIQSVRLSNPNAPVPVNPTVHQTMSPLAEILDAFNDRLDRVTELIQTCLNELDL